MPNVTEDAMKRMDFVARGLSDTVRKINPGFLKFINNETCYVKDASVCIDRRHIRKFNEQEYKYEDCLSDECYKFSFTLKSNIQAHTRTYYVFFEDEDSFYMYVTTSFSKTNDFVPAKVKFVSNVTLNSTFVKKPKELCVNENDELNLVGVLTERDEKWDDGANYWQGTYFNNFCYEYMLNKFKYYKTFYFKNGKDIYVLKLDFYDDSEKYFVNC